MHDQKHINTAYRGGKFVGYAVRTDKLSLRRAQRRGNLLGFTLAEVLITLSIIGVVAVLTVPTVVKNYEKSQTIAGYKKIYSDLDSATKLIASENGGSISGALPFSHSTWKYRYADKFKTSLVCGGAIANRPNCGLASNTEHTLDGNNILWQSLGSNAFVTNTGVFISFFSNSPPICPSKQSPNGVGCAYAIVDLNGHKVPNRLGRHIHMFKIFADGVLPRNNCSSDSTKHNCCNENIDPGNGEGGMTCGLEILNGNYDWEN